MLADLLLLKICLIRQIIINSSETLRDQGTQQWEIDPGYGTPQLISLPSTRWGPSPWFRGDCTPPQFLIPISC